MARQPTIMLYQYIFVKLARNLSTLMATIITKHKSLQIWVLPRWGLRHILPLLLVVTATSNADVSNETSVEPPPVRTGSQTIYLGKEQSTEITIKQKPGEFTLLVLEAQGVDFTMELLNPKTEPGPQYYNDTWFESYLNLNFLLKSSDCETCRIKNYHVL